MSAPLAAKLTDGRQRSMMSVDDVATELHCSVRHVRRLADSGRMPKPIKLGSLLRWPRVVIENWIANNCPDLREGSCG